MHIDIVKATVADLQELQILSRNTFSETFSSLNTEDNMRLYLDKEFAHEKLIKELSDPDSQFHFARVNNISVGYLKVNKGKSQTELKESNGMEVERIYVLKEFHGKEVGQLLFDKAIQIANDGDINYVWLGVWEKNLRAIRFYEKNEFVLFGTHGFKVGNDEQTDVLMKRILK